MHDSCDMRAKSQQAFSCNLNSDQQAFSMLCATTQVADWFWLQINALPGPTQWYNCTPRTPLQEINCLKSACCPDVISVNGKTHLQCICKLCSRHGNTPHKIQDDLTTFPKPQISSSWQWQEMPPPSSRQSFGSFEIRMLHILQNSPYDVQLQPR